jgi:hypothetical protein
VSHFLRATGLLFAGLALACTGAPSELVVVVDVDPALGATDLEIEVTEPDGDFEATSITLADLEGRLPTLGLVLRGGSPSPVVIDVRAYSGTTEATARAITGFQVGERRVLRIGVYASCTAAACSDEQTCDASGNCVSALVGSDRLSPWTGEPQPLTDAGPGPDAPPTDGAPTDDAPTRERCVFGWTCTDLGRCLGTGVDRSCQPFGTATTGEACATDEECGVGACIPVANVCSTSCRRNADCELVAGHCVADELSLVGLGACRAASACPGCTSTDSVCIRNRDGSTACVAGGTCFFTTDCDTGEVCSVPPRAAGGTGVCMPGTECTGNEVRLIDVAAGGASVCTNGVRSCTTATDCENPEYPECITATQLDAVDAGGLGICVRRP